MIDQMAYNYQTGTNKLNYIADPYHPTSADIEGQSANNYTYDAIGNLTQDVKGGINDIMWNPYGKITRIDKGTNGVLLYSYDAMGNRIKKSFTQSNDNVDKIWYVRDAQGNIMAIYSRKNYGTNQQVLLENYELYGSSRLGSLNLGLAVEGDYNLTVTTNYTRSLGLKQYELSNHLGNVLTTFSDQRVFAPTGMSSTNSNALIAKLISAQDYYPFGMIMDGRSWNTDKVKFGFNGKENDNEIAGNNNSLDFGARIYNSRIGKFFSIDPLFAKSPEESSYIFAGNNPIYNLDIGGKFKYPAKEAATYKNEFPMLTLYLSKYVKNDVLKSQTICDGMYKKAAIDSWGNYPKRESFDALFDKALSWSEKKVDEGVPTIYFENIGGLLPDNTEDGSGFRGYYVGGPDSKLQIDWKFAKRIEGILASDETSDEEKMAALYEFNSVLLNETGHFVDWTIDGVRVDYEPGAELVQEIFGDRPIEGTDQMLHSNIHQKGEAQKSIEYRKSIGQTDVLPTVPKEKPSTGQKKKR